MKTIGSVLKRLLLALGGSASENYLNDITLVDRIAELAENGDIDPSVIQGGGSAEKYEVGDIFISTNSTSPAARFGGTWTQIKDTFLLASGDTYAAGATGGEATVTLTVNQIPAHKHNLLGEFGAAGSASFSPWTTYTQLAGSSATTKMRSDVSMDNTGGGQAHNNMPPYLAVYVWKRIA